MESLFVVLLNSYGSSILYAILFHVVNVVGILLANIVHFDNLKGYKWASAALRRFSVETVDGIIRIN